MTLSQDKETCLEVVLQMEKNIHSRVHSCLGNEYNVENVAIVLEKTFF